MLLLAITWIITLEGTKLFSVLGREISVKDLILIAGGLFLLGKATWEIHENLEGSMHGHGSDEQGGAGGGKTASFAIVLSQVIALDVVFSIDSVLTAVGMVRPEDYAGSAPLPGTGIPWPPLVIMATAVLLAIAVMLIFVGPISRFIRAHPALKMLALSFLLLIGIVLVAEGLHDRAFLQRYTVGHERFLAYVTGTMLRLLHAFRDWLQDHVWGVPQPDPVKDLTFDQESVVVTFKDGRVEQIFWNELDAVFLETSGAGGAGSVYWGMVAGERVVTVADNVGDCRKLGDLFRLMPDIDRRALTAAYAYPDTGRVVIWERGWTPDRSGPSPFAL